MHHDTHGPATITLTKDQLNEFFLAQANSRRAGLHPLDGFILTMPTVEVANAETDFA